MKRFDFQSAPDIERSVSRNFLALSNVLNSARGVERIDAATVTATGSVTFTKNWIKVKLAGNWTPTFVGIQAGGLYILEIEQSDAGSNTVTFPAALEFGTAGAPTITTTANKTDLVLILAISATSYYGFTILQDA